MRINLLNIVDMQFTKHDQLYHNWTHNMLFTAKWMRYVVKNYYSELSF